jgi:hypothetical protein
MCRVGNLRQINNSAEDGTNGYFRRIPAVPRKRELSEFRPESSVEEKKNSEVRGTKIEAISWNAVPNHSAEEKTTQSKSRQPKISKKVPEKTTFENGQIILLSYIVCFVKLFFSPRNSVPFELQI